MTSEEKITAFFAPPVPPQSTGKGMSVLHLLRREVQDCYFGDVFPEEEALQRPGRRRLFATAILLVAGIDLLAKLYEGTDNNGGAGRRFKAFASRFVFQGFRDSELLAEVLWTACRNPLLHSFGLHNQQYTLRVLENLSAPVGQPQSVIVQLGDHKSFLLSVDGLFAAFCRAVAEYQELLMSDRELRRRFEAQVLTYGQIDVSDVQIVPSDNGFTIRPLR